MELLHHRAPLFPFSSHSREDSEEMLTCSSVRDPKASLKIKWVLAGWLLIPPQNPHSLCMRLLYQCAQHRFKPCTIFQEKDALIIHRAKPWQYSPSSLFKRHRNQWFLSCCLFTINCSMRPCTKDLAQVSYESSSHHSPVNLNEKWNDLDAND